MFTRVPSDYKRPDRRRPITIILIVGAAIYLLLTALGTLWTDYLWFDSIGFENIWQRKWGMSILLGVLGVALTFLILWISLQLVDRLSPGWAPFDLSEEEELIERFREWIEPRIRQVRIWVTAGLALLLGLTVASWRDDVFLYMNSQEFGRIDPIFEKDVGFYVFDLPLFETATDWLFNVLVLATVVTIVAHYFNGGVRFTGRSFTTTRKAKMHISILLALIALVRAVVYRLDMYELMLSSRVEPAFFGPGFADINARLPAFRLLLVVAVVAAALFVANIFRQGWTLALVVVGACGDDGETKLGAGEACGTTDECEASLVCFDDLDDPGSPSCEPPTGEAGTACRDDDDCMSGLECDVHEGEGACLEPHDDETG